MSIQKPDGGKPNPDDFSKAEFPGEYEVRFHIEGFRCLTIKAASEAEARDIAQHMADDENDCEMMELDDIDYVKVARLYKKDPMFRALRDGRKMQVSRLIPGDLPREPDERGF